MEWLFFILSFLESYVVIIPYLLVGALLCRKVCRISFANVWTLILTDLAFWAIFLLGFIVVAFAAQVVIMFRHAEKV